MGLSSATWLTAGGFFAAARLLDLVDDDPRVEQCLIILADILCMELRPVVLTDVITEPNVVRLVCDAGRMYAKKFKNGPSGNKMAVATSRPIGKLVLMPP